MMLNVHVKGIQTYADAQYLKTGNVNTDLFGDGWRSITDQTLLRKLHEIRNSKGLAGTMKDPIWAELLANTADPDTISVKVATRNSIPVLSSQTTPAGNPFAFDTQMSEEEKATMEEAERKRKEALAKAKRVDFLKKISQRWLDFFKEFMFRPNTRVMNAIANLKTVTEVRDYVVGYFQLTNNPFAKDIFEKTKSSEFQSLAAETCNTATHVVNKRLVVWFGDPGTGKTYTAIKENPEADVIGCHASMTPDDLYRTFDFVDGKGTFKPSPLHKAMVEGKTIIFDEMNLLSIECLRALQEILDGKEIVNLCNQNVKIKEGFRIVGTMNLNVDGQVWSLPSPFLDRAAEIKEFSLTAEQLAELAF